MELVKIIIVKKRKVSLLIRVSKISMGATFWGINNNHSLSQDKALATDTSHPCKGATPIFKLNAAIRISLVLVPLLERKLIQDKINTEDIAWFIKYFNAPSLWYFLLFSKSKGIKINRLISRKIHIVSHDSADKTRKMLIIMRLKNNRLEGCKKIFYFGVNST